MKNKVVVASVVISLLIFFGFQILKMFPDINLKYNHAFLSTQLVVVFINMTIIMFAVFGYSILTYIIAFISFWGLMRTSLRYIFPADYITRFSNVANFLYYYVIAFLLTFLTFYILKKCKVNLNVPANKKEA